MNRIGNDILSNPERYFGSKVIVSARFEKRRVGHKKEWLKVETARGVGMVVGVRYLRNGRVYFYEDHIEWNPEGDTIPCVLVVFGPRTNTVRVPIDSVEQVLSNGIWVDELED